MNSIEKTISTIKGDLGEEVSNKDEYLASCVLERLSEKSKKYDEDFDKFIESIGRENLNEKDFAVLTRRIEVFSKTIDKLYKSLISSFQKIDKNL